MGNKINQKLGQKDIREFAPEDLGAQIKEASAGLRQKKFSHAVATLDNPAGIRNDRRNIARLLTELNRRKQEQSK
jgi:large subunit ribosomal protein L29